MTVYIMTRDRQDNLRKIVPRWLDQNMRVVLVTERSEQDEHVRLVRRERWGSDRVIVISPQRERGIGHKRRYAVNHAKALGLQSIIMSDDDMQPANNTDMNSILWEARNPKVLGIGATRSLHDRNSRGAVSANHGLILCPGGWGMQMFSLNIENTLAVGNFDSELDCFGEDAELERMGIATIGIPWLVHCDVRCNAIGVRYDPGGINAYITDGTRALREVACRRIIHERWPMYASHPERKPRMLWQKMLDDYIPNWRERSAIHGGRWE
jgi:hypothetical protein